MVEIGVPVYNALKTLPKLLDSLVSQTNEKFIVCLSFDGDNLDYSEIINKYINNGLHIRTIYQENQGPGVARQHVIDTTQCDYIIFADADDMLMPRAVEVLYSEAKLNNFDVMRSNFIREDSKSLGSIMGNNSPITWCHGKIYKVSYLKNNNISFLKELKSDEDAYFNLIAWNSTENKGELNEITYIWRDNPNSLTRLGKGKSDFVERAPLNYFYSQLIGLNKIFEITGSINSELISMSLINIYWHYIYEKVLNINMTEVDALLNKFKEYDWFKNYLNSAENISFLAKNTSQGDIIENNIVFCKENIYDWINRIMRSNDESNSY